MPDNRKVLSIWLTDDQYTIIRNEFTEAESWTHSDILRTVLTDYFAARGIQFPENENPHGDTARWKGKP